MSKVNRPAVGNTSRATWSSREAYGLGIACLLVGAILGYIFRGSGPPETATSARPESAPSTQTPAASMPSFEDLNTAAAPLLAALKANPKNPDLLIQLGNLYYDHRNYPGAIEYYKSALDLRADDPNVRTDLATAYWYSGRAEKAVAEYNKVLAQDPAFAQALFNLGVVRLEGLKDAAGAVAVWQKLLATNPQYAGKERVLELIKKAQSQVSQ